MEVHAMSIMEHVSKKNVIITDDFFEYYTKLVKDTIIPYQWDALNDRIPNAEPSHAVKNFRIAAGIEEGEFYGFVFQDSDIAKWLEAVGHSLMTHPDPELEKTADAMIDLIEEAQCPDGYLDTYFIINKHEERWSNLCECHELYCAGHMIEAAVAYYEATGKDKLLKIVCRFVDLIDSIFGPEDGKIKGYPGHQEIELALVKLYKATGNIRYLKLSEFFINERGKEPNYFIYEWDKIRGRISHWEKRVAPAPHLPYNQAHKPVRQQDTAVGHSVRAVYMYTAMADIAYETKDKELAEACTRIWTDITQRQMYITGGIGATYHGEAFTFDYDLPNDTVYAETCASIGLIFFANRMQKMNLSNEYGDVIEKILYNLLPGSMSRRGKEFFYVNPLEVWPEASEKDPGKQHVKAVRQKWFGCACCPPNIARLIASLGDYIYSTDADTIYTHLYISGHVEAAINNQRVSISQESNYPYHGDVSFNVSVDKPTNFKLALRIPSWCRKYEIYVCGQKIEFDVKNGYAILNRTWNDNDNIVLSMDMPVELMVSHPKVRENAGKVCIMRGPIVYCLEEVDNGPNLPSITLCLDKEINIQSCETLPEAKVIVTAQGTRNVEDGCDEALYRPYNNIKITPVTIKAIPYYLWGNRGEGEMIVWIRAK
jgi:DUF1680 family protein